MAVGRRLPEKLIGGDVPPCWVAWRNTEANYEFARDMVKSRSLLWHMPRRRSGAVFHKIRRKLSAVM